MKIAVDLDDTLADSLTSFIEFYNKNYKPKIKYEDFIAYTLNEIIGISKEEENKILEQFDNSKYCDEVKPIKGAVEAIKKIIKKHEIVVITQRLKRFETKTRLWLAKYFPEIKDVFFIRNEYHKLVKSKAEICKEIGADILIDDAISNVVACEKAGIKVIVINYPWNQNKIFGKLVRRVKSWEEIASLL